ncbi:hypothetical protein [Curvibacter lanceolatus]|uniref:hypothetical protein n=1 Tax=Curvibacter lanceolatus TaxID=86182 RepID=UPI00146EE45E|nr:hypothetical protein [Curvibacter lanceolatus]
MSETPTPEIQTRREALPLAGRQMELRGFQRSQADNSAPDSSPLATAQIVFTTGAGVKCFDWFRDRAYVEELVVEEGAIRLDRLRRGGAAPEHPQPVEPRGPARRGRKPHHSKRPRHLQRDLLAP